MYIYIYTYSYSYITNNDQSTQILNPTCLEGFCPRTESHKTQGHQFKEEGVVLVLWKDVNIRK